MNQRCKCSQSVTVNLENGLHLVPCSQIARVAGKFQSDVQIRKDALRVNAKNIFDLMTLSAEHGTTLILEASGADAADAIRALAQRFESNFADE